MKKQKFFYKRINFGLKNAIVIRTNIDPEEQLKNRKQTGLVSYLLYED